VDGVFGQQPALLSGEEGGSKKKTNIGCSVDLGILCVLSSSIASTCHPQHPSSS
jgi:hypothetical protein